MDYSSENNIDSTENSEKKVMIQDLNFHSTVENSDFSGDVNSY